ncbi:MAG: YbaB/EbfC family nucleoid-associated protein [Candidatus Komeilibacteria bacterium]|nr:YbaB/EbfC family nucleoid-associated protein [Candidatus Komeilibacteria bacterium]
MFHKLKQFNDLRKQANSLKSKLAQETVKVDNRAVTLTMDGNQEVQEVSISTEYASPDKKHQLEQHVKDAVNDAIKKAQRVMAAKMRESGDFKIPGLS